MEIFLNIYVIVILANLFGIAGGIFYIVTESIKTKTRIRDMNNYACQRAAAMAFLSGILYFFVFFTISALSGNL